MGITQTKLTVVRPQPSLNDLAVKLRVVGFTANCTEDQFECSNGLCVPLNWVCDNDNDCKDYSDEFNCTKTG